MYFLQPFESFFYSQCLSLCYDCQSKSCVIMSRNLPHSLSMWFVFSLTFKFLNLLIIQNLDTGNIIEGTSNTVEVLFKDCQWLYRMSTLHWLDTPLHTHTHRKDKERKRGTYIPPISTISNSIQQAILPTTKRLIVCTYINAATKIMYYFIMY